MCLHLSSLSCTLSSYVLAFARSTEHFGFGNMSLRTLGGKRWRRIGKGIRHIHSAAAATNFIIMRTKINLLDSRSLHSLIKSFNPNSLSVTRRFEPRNLHDQFPTVLPHMYSNLLVLISFSTMALTTMLFNPPFHSRPPTIGMIMRSP